MHARNASTSRLARPSRPTPSHVPRSQPPRTSPTPNRLARPHPTSLHAPQTRISHACRRARRPRGTETLRGFSSCPGFRWTPEARLHVRRVQSPHARRPLAAHLHLTRPPCVRPTAMHTQHTTTSTPRPPRASATSPHAPLSHLARATPIRCTPPHRTSVASLHPYFPSPSSTHPVHSSPLGKKGSAHLHLSRPPRPYKRHPTASHIRQLLPPQGGTDRPQFGQLYRYIHRPLPSPLLCPVASSATAYSLRATRLTQLRGLRRCSTLPADSFANKKRNGPYPASNSGSQYETTWNAEGHQSSFSNIAQQDELMNFLGRQGTWYLFVPRV
ncbi:hypothetical protein C8R46DRAFT_1220856 [Mycena filopes]|nr:hypothetical protein C8R46DRAFT_1220856 [Mycena filopes]